MSETISQEALDALVIPRIGLDRTPHPPNRHAGSVLEDTLNWGSRLGLDTMVGAEKFEELAWLSLGIIAHTEPTLDAEQLKLPARQCFGLFVQDAKVDGESDPNEEFYAVSGGMHRIIYGGERFRNNPYASAWTDLDQEVRDRTDGVQHKMWRDVVIGYNEGTKNEMRLQRLGRTPTLGAFKQMRWHTSGVQVMFSLIAPARGIVLPETAWQNPAIKVETRAAGDAVADDNDLLSLKRELAKGRADLNAVVVVQRNSPGLGLQQAIDQVVRMRNRAERRFLNQQQDLGQAGFDPEILGFVQEYAKGLGFWIKGQLQFVYGQSPEGDKRYEG